MSPLEQFDATLRTVTQERGAIYGHPADQLSRLAQLAEVLDDCADPTMRQVLYMILVKVSRLIATPDHLDSLIDIAGYARTGAMILERRSDD